MSDKDRKEALGSVEQSRNQAPLPPEEAGEIASSDVSRANRSEVLATSFGNKLGEGNGTQQIGPHQQEWPIRQV
jgi:hypothetical protein